MSKSNNQSIILLSGGLDSSVCLAKAVEETKVQVALTFNYGQKAFAPEVKNSRKLCDHYGIKHLSIDLPFLKELTNTALVAEGESIPEVNQEQLDDLSVCQDTAAKVWVPNRNGLFVNIAGCYAESYNAQIIIAGFNREEAATFSDNSKEFINACDNSLALSTLNKPKVMSYTIDLDKTEIVQLGKALNLPFEYVWSCYYGMDQPCNTCESCNRLNRALRNAGVSR